MPLIARAVLPMRLRLWHALGVHGDVDDLRRELRFVDGLVLWARTELYGVREGGWRAEATTAVAASAAEETYRLVDGLDDWHNATSAVWRAHLGQVWQFLEGDRSLHYALSRAVAGYLTSPLNHNEGQDGPDDFDRPQTIASYSATLAAVTWGVDFAVTAIRQIFEAIDLRYETLHREPGERWRDVQVEAEFVRRIVTTAARAGEAGPPYSQDVLNSIKS